MPSGIIYIQYFTGDFYMKTLIVICISMVLSTLFFFGESVVADAENINQLEDCVELNEKFQQNSIKHLVPAKKETDYSHVSFEENC